MADLRDVATDLVGILKAAVPALEAVGEDASLRTRGEGSWSRKQVLGHLVDSALNNLHRFVRAQQAGALAFPGYEQESWVALGGYQDRPWHSIVSLWAELNAQAAHVIARIPAERLATPCHIGDGEPVTLEFVARDYVRHLRHHLEQILEPEGSRGKQHRSFAEPGP
ncbi:MAG TPA: DinB family protein [Vicinamibacteria bacterium]|jgi:hypothetical protein